MSVSIQLDHGTSFNQWDKNRYLYIIGYSETATRVKVHYTTSISGVAFVVLPTWDATEGKWRAGVPSTVLTIGNPVNVYIYDEDLEINQTVYKFTVPVEIRSQPEDYIYDSYSENTLIWPYEDNIEAILRREQERIEAEQARESNESGRVLAEISRESAETDRQSAESIRVQNEKIREKLLASLQDDLTKVDGLIREVTGARGTFSTLGDRLDSIDDLNSVVNVTISDDGSILVSFADGHVVNIGQVPVGGAGQQIIKIERTSGDGSPGSTDIYTIYVDTGETYKFTVYNGKDGKPGAPGERGVSGVYIGNEDPGTEYQVWIDTDGNPDVEVTGVTFIPSVSPDGVISWTNDSQGTLPNPSPVNIKGSDGVTYTPEVSDTGDLSWSNDGDLPNPPTKNVRGISGVYVGNTEPTDPEYNVWVDTDAAVDPEIRGITFTPYVDDLGNLSWSNDGGLTNPETKNIRGPKGAVYTPSVSDTGDLSWSNDGGLDNPDPVNVRGPAGTVYVPSYDKSTGLLSWSNDGGLDNPDPVYIRGITGYVFTPSVSPEGVISWTNNGNLTNPAPISIRGPQGSKGSTFTPSVSDEGIISWTNDGGLSNPSSKNIKGPKGNDGVIFTPSVDSNGDLSWSNNGGLANPPTVNIKGPAGSGGGPAEGGNADTLQGHDASYFATATHDHEDATQSKHGFLSINDKVALDTLKGSGAQDVGTGASPTFGTVTADAVVGAVYM